MKQGFFFSLIFCLTITGTIFADEALVITPEMYHLRISGEREWSAFPEMPQADELLLSFQAKSNSTESTLLLRQVDVKLSWNVELNKKVLGKLSRDGNDLQFWFSVPPGVLKNGKNQLRIFQVGKPTPDDIYVGEISLFPEPVQQALAASQLSIEVVDGHSGDLIPARITIVNSEGTLVATTAKSNQKQAVRSGVIYVSEGKTEFSLPAGQYTIYAGRGFEYGIDRRQVTLKAGENQRLRFKIRREVDTTGYVSSDTHVHTLTHSGHGDCSIEERMITLAGEQIEFPIATDHNKQINYEPLAQKLNVRKYFTPVIGNEVTTRIGHFNIFPAQESAPVPDYKLKDWTAIFNSIFEKPLVKVAILNHARDLHSNYRPFGQKHHLSQTGENLDGWKLRANAMEIINSGATQTDVMQLYHDWFGALNRGLFLTPVGCSDSHDVTRYIVGQARTYIEAKDHDPSKIETGKTIQNFVEGKILLSYGLFTQIKVNSQYGPGELVASSSDLEVAITVSGPSWVSADEVSLYANGQLIRREEIKSKTEGGVKWQETWKLKRFPHDCHLVAIATGPGVTAPYWPLAKPYQPDSPDFEPVVVGSTGAVWIDADGDGQKTPAYEYADQLVNQHATDLSELLKSLEDYDLAVTMQAASLLRSRGVAPYDSKLNHLLQDSPRQVQNGFNIYKKAWRASQITRQEN
ncbi:CehA/McbA family metallohydrolase [Gimesia aquarii]|uniref:Uncharacterized protein n=1 Tax=Gimesia aquarii TaxID=2527964 RepID=A0A517W0U5_9PLAN|nr:CehA/McbA family metallohydrolase [Gimesia aquarii]QDT98875.1 hypothetical protein V144x_43850 [Gimesia aquarii]